MDESSGIWLLIVRVRTPIRVDGGRVRVRKQWKCPSARHRLFVNPHVSNNGFTALANRDSFTVS